MNEDLVLINLMSYQLHNKIYLSFSFENSVARSISIHYEVGTRFNDFVSRLMHSVNGLHNYLYNLHTFYLR